jgi:hypothetical protein
VSVGIEEIMNSSSNRPKRMPGLVGLAVLYFALLVVSAQSVGAAQVVAGQEQLPYAPPPVMGFGNVLCAPAFACAPPQQASAAPQPSQEPKIRSDQQQLLYEQTRPQQEIPFTPADFDKYVGFYEFAFPDGDVLVSVYRQENRYYWQVENAGQPPTEFFPESRTEFFATEFAAQLSFVTAPDGQVTKLILHEMGVQHMARRVPQAAFQAWVENLRSRMNAHEPSTRTDVALRRQLEAWERMARATAVPPAPIVRTVKGLGRFEGLKFIKTGPHGWDIYEATYSKGDLRCSIMPLSSGGKVNGLECDQVLHTGP